MKTSIALHKLLVVTLMAITLIGCSSSPILDKPDSNDVSLVFGYIDMAEAPSSMSLIAMKRMQPVTDTPYYDFWVVDGVFFRGNVPEGTYKFSSFGGFSMLRNASITYNFPQQGKGELDRRIKKPGIYYVGSYQYKKIDTSFFSPDKFELKPVNTPTELELLHKILPYAEDAYLKNMIENRIKVLSK